MLSPEKYNHDLPLGHSREKTLKYILRDILAKREKAGQH